MCSAGPGEHEMKLGPKKLAMEAIASRLEAIAIWLHNQVLDPLYNQSY